MFAVFLIASVSYSGQNESLGGRAGSAPAAAAFPTQLGLIFSAFSWSYALARSRRDDLGVAAPAPHISHRPVAVVHSPGFDDYGDILRRVDFLRIPFGLAEAVTWPAASVLMSRWFPAHRIFAGHVAAESRMVVGAPWRAHCRLHHCLLGWKAAFIVTGLMAGILGTLFYIYTKDDPADDPRVSPEELAWIRHDQVADDDAPLPKGFIWMLLGRPSLWAVAMRISGWISSTSCFSHGIRPISPTNITCPLGRMGVMAMEPYIFGLITVPAPAGWCAR